MMGAVSSSVSNGGTGKQGSDWLCGARQAWDISQTCSCWVPGITGRLQNEAVPPSLTSLSCFLRVVALPVATSSDLSLV